MRQLVRTIAFATTAALLSLFADAGAQDTAPAVVGAVVDSSSGVPLSQVGVYLDGNHLVTQSNTEGEFGLVAMPAGSHTLHLIRNGYRPQTYRLTVPEDATGEVDIGVAALAAGPAPSASVSGSVMDAVSGQAVAAARVTVNGGKSTFSTADGAFFLAEPALRWGPNWLEFRSIGYEPMVAALWVLTDEATTDLAVKLAPHAILMPEVVVEGERTTYAYGRIRHFYRRRRIGSGEFFTRADIAEIRPIFVSSLLNRIQGVTPVSLTDGTRVIRMFGRKGYCVPLVYWNGIRATDLNIDMFWPEDLEGVEVYRGPSQIPPEFNPTGSACGVVVLWTR